MNVNDFKHFLINCRKFVNKMKKHKISLNDQFVLMKYYIQIYNSNYNININLTDNHITELIIQH